MWDQQDMSVIFADCDDGNAGVFPNADEYCNGWMTIAMG